MPWKIKGQALRKEGPADFAEAFFCCGYPLSDFRKVRINKAELMFSHHVHILGLLETGLYFPLFSKVITKVHGKQL